MVNETSTPKRVSFHTDKFSKNVTPLRRKTMNKQREVDDFEIGNNDEEERNKRRSIAEIRKSTPNLNLSINLSNRSTPNVTIPFTALEQHFKTCLTLFTSNKITSENVWNLKYMDYLGSMLKRETDTSKLLQTASATVDIGAKIYSIQVDDVYTTSIKLVNQLSKVKVSDTQNESVENMDVEEIQNGDIEKQKKKPKSRSSKKKSTIAEDDQSLNSPNETHRLLGVINESENLKEKLNSECVSRCFKVLSVMESKKVLWRDVNVEKCILMVDLVALLPQKDVPTRLCPNLKDFSLDVWDVNKDDTMMNDSMELDQADNRGDNPWQLDPDPNELNQSIVEDIGIDGEHNEPETVFVTSLLPILSDITSKQHCAPFSHRPLPTIHDRVWAGPDHWKWKILKRNKENATAASGTDAQKAKKPRKVIMPVSFSKIMTLKEIINKIKKERKTCSTRKTVKINSTLPENLKITKNCCLGLFSYVEVQVRTHEKSKEVEENLNKTYSYDNPDDNDYCNLTVHEDNDHHSNDSQTYFDEFNAVACEKNEKDTVPFALKAKQMNMKKLKGYIWDEIEQKQNEKISLSEVYTKLPSKMPESMNENMSPALAMVALLHLANEQNLVLESIKLDITIKKT